MAHYDNSYFGTVLNFEQQKYQSISYNGLYFIQHFDEIHQLTQLVEKNSESLSNQFCFVYDEWSNNNTHHVSVFAIYHSNNDLWYTCNLLGFGPFEDETSSGSQELYNYLSFTLSVYEKMWDNVTAVVCDIFTVNERLASKLNCGFVGYSTHRFNLAVCNIINKEKDLLDKENAIMKSLNTQSTQRNYKNIHKCVLP